MIKKKRHSKHYSRCCATQALYQWSHTQHSPQQIVEEFTQYGYLKQADRKYFKMLVLGTIEQCQQLDLLITPHLDREISALNPVELAILRISAFELLHCPELPYRVIINEALEVAKDYGADQSYKYVNAVLDGLAAKWRVHEYDLDNK